VTKGYWNNDKANRESFKDGWFCTGDIAVFRDGFFFIVDRKKVIASLTLRTPVDRERRGLNAVIRNSSNTRETKLRPQSSKPCCFPILRSSMRL
jgi:acyl-CoA synthetase (AMP-forming)/AMP-acid ligase II